MNPRSSSPDDLEIRLARRRRWRFGLILAVSALAMVAAAAAGWHYARVSSPPSGPLVLVSIDSLRADHLAAYGYQKVETPAIDALAAEGVVFERAYAQSPLTLPSHVALLSGQLPFESGVRTDTGGPIPSQVRLLPRLLQNRGWATGGVVSSYLLRRDVGLDRGFDFFDSRIPPAPGETPDANVERAGDRSLEVAARWMDTLSSPRFFLFLHLNEPHAPHRAPPRFERFGPYDGEIAAADAVVGDLSAVLKKHGWYDQATIVLVSDHGEGLGEHGEQEHGVFLYDDTIRVPLIVKMPRDEQHVRRIAAPVQLLDVVPTLLDWLEAPRPTGLRGRSLLPLMQGDAPTVGAPPLSYAESWYGPAQAGWSDLASVTDGRYRFIRAPRPEVYDLVADPGEQRNLAGEAGPPAAALQQSLEHLLGAAASQRPATLTTGETEKLQALGYGIRPATDVAAASVTDPPDPKDRVGALEQYNRATALAAGANHDAAIDVLRGLVASEPGLRDAWVALGREMVAEGRTGEATAAFTRVVELDPRHAGGLPSLAATLLAAGRTEQAIAHAELALELVRPSDRRARVACYVVLVRAAFARNDRDAARRVAQRAEAEYPALPLASFVEGRALFEDGKYADALPLFEQARAAMDGDPAIIAGLDGYAGETLLELQRTDEAERALQEEVRLSPLEVRHWIALASLYRSTDRLAAAQRVIADLVRTTPAPEAYKAAVRFWTTAGDRARADSLRSEARARALAVRRSQRR